MRFEVIVNGQKHCVAGQPGFGVLSAILTWVKRNPAKHSPTARMNEEDFCKEEATFEISGLDSNDAEHTVHTYWTRREGIGPLHVKPGDEIILRVLPAGVADAPFAKSPQLRDRT